MLDSRAFTFLRAAALCAAVAVVVGACAGAAAGWTFAPEPSATPVPSASAGPSGSVAPSASTSPSGSGSVGPSGGGAPTVVKIVAQNIAYDTKEIQVPGGQPFTIEFDNQDSGIPHNVAIKDASGTQVFMGEIFTGPGQRTYQVPPLTKGAAYTFVCDVHPTMTGTVTVQ